MQIKMARRLPCPANIPYGWPCYDALFFRLPCPWPAPVMMLFLPERLGKRALTLFFIIAEYRLLRFPALRALLYENRPAGEGVAPCPVDER